MKKDNIKEVKGKVGEVCSSEEKKEGPVCKHWFINWTLFVVLGIFLFSLVQKIIVPRWNWPEMSENVSWNLESFKSLEKNSEDVLFIGTSHLQLGVSPMELYKEYGIVSYNLCTAAQPLDLSYYLLEEAYKTQSPKYVVIDASAIFFTDERYQNTERRKIIDSLPLSVNKIEMAKTYSELKPNASDKEKMEEINSIIFPIINYHTNWKTITETNFDFKVNPNYCTAGYIMSSHNNGVVDKDKADVDALVDRAMADNTRIDVVRDGGDDIKIYEKENVLYDPVITETQRENIKKLKELCKEHNTKLIIVKVPLYDYPYNYTSSWDHAKYERMKAFAQEMDVEYFDMMYEADIRFDMAKDFHDEGWHLNYSGAVKLSKCLGEYLSSKYGIGGKTNAYMDAHMKDYDKMASLAGIELEYDFQKYTQLLSENADDLVVCVVAKEEWEAGLNEADVNALNTLGLYDKIKEYSDQGNAYLALIDAGEVKFEQISNRTMAYGYDFSGKYVKLVSGGADSSNIGDIYLDGSQESLSKKGLNILVIDKTTGKVVDCSYISTDTAEEHKVMHSLGTNNYLYDDMFCDN